ncbi:MAG: ABC transporter permease [Phycisphaerae bacterium]
MKKEIGIGLLVFLVAAIVAALQPRAFLSTENLQNLATLIGIFGIFSIGSGIVIITSGIDLSIGSAFALQGVAFCMLVSDAHMSWPLALLLTTLGVLLLGVLHGFLIAQFKLQPFIVTLCGLLIYRGEASDIAHEETKGLGDLNLGSLQFLASGKLGPVPMPFVLLIIVSVIMAILLHRSVYGRYLYAVGRNEEAARYSGINTKLVIGTAYVLSMLTVAISGILLVFYSGSVVPSNYGSFYELYGIAAAVLGGCSLRGGEGSILGILFGTTLLQLLQNAVNLLGWRSSRTLTVMGVVILLGAIMDQYLQTRRRKPKPEPALAASPARP